MLWMRRGDMLVHRPGAELDQPITADIGLINRSRAK
jgi:hypothetical protein